MTSISSAVDSNIWSALRAYLSLKCDQKDACRSPAKRKSASTGAKCIMDNSIKPPPESAEAKSLSKVYGYEKWLRSFGLKHSWEIDPDSVEIYIWHGYRPNPSSLTYSVKSVFYPTNETLNIWTHFIPFLLMLYRTHCIFTSLESPTDLIYWPFWLHSFGCCYVLMVSFLAHMLNSMSASAQELCMCVDYGAIATYGITNMIVYQLYVCPLKCFLDAGKQLLGAAPDIAASAVVSLSNVAVFSYILTGMSIGYCVQFMSCFSRHQGCPHRILVRFLPTMLCYLTITIPVTSKWITSLFGGPYAFHPEDELACSLGSGKFGNLFLIHTSLFFAAGTSAFLRFPERFYPGVFDIIGHSHQIFHVLIALGLYTQSLMVEIFLRDIKPLHEKRLLFAEDLAISEWTTVYPIGLFLTVCFCIACTFSNYLGGQVQQRRRKLC